MAKGSRDDVRPSKRYPASKKERRRLAAELEPVLGREPGSMEIAEFKEGFRIIIVDGFPAVIEHSDRKLPHLLALVRKRIEPRMPRVVVDRGATQAVARGATLMVPGIRSVEGEFKQGDIVIVVDEEAGVPVAVGVALMDSEEIRERLAGERRGRAVRILHRPGDKYWKAGERLIS